MIKNIKETKGKDFNVTRSADEVRNLSFKNHICIGCGICESTCPVGAIDLGDVATNARAKVDVYFSGHDKIAQNINEPVDLQKVNVNEDKCVLCGMCSGLCPVDALVLTIDGVPIAEIDEYPSYNVYTIIDDDKCLLCQKCQNACPREAITIERQLPNRVDLVTGEIEVNEEKCINCGVCSELCPAEAIVVDPTTGQESIVIDKDKCVYCLVCKKACPVNAIRAVCRSCSYGEYDLDPELAKVKGSAIIEDALCVRCGWCEGVCPADAVEVKKPFEGTLVVDQDKCGTCGACVDLCPCNALAFPISEGPGSRMEHVIASEEYCIKCGACANICPNEAITVTRTAIDNTPINSITWNKAFDALKN